jgi:hypothetical protein
MMSDKDFEIYLTHLATCSSEEDLKLCRDERECEKALLELGIKRNAKDFVEILLDEVKLKEVISKLKLKAFW